MAVPAAVEVHDSAQEAKHDPEAEGPPTDEQPEQTPPSDEERLEKVISDMPDRFILSPPLRGQG